MNNIIKQLEPQCWEMSEFGLRFNYEKYAELIVKECSKVILAQNDSFNVIDEWDRGYSIGLESSEDAIKKHFGVEE